MDEIEERSIALWVILSLITCYLASVIWLVLLGNDIAQARNSKKPQPIVDILLTIVTCGLWGLFVLYKWPEYINEAGKKHQVEVEDLRVLSLVLGLLQLPFVSLALMQNELNKIANLKSERRDREPS